MLLVRGVVEARSLGSDDVCDVPGRVARESGTGCCEFCVTAKLRGDDVNGCVRGQHFAYDLIHVQQLDLFSQYPALAMVTSTFLYSGLDAGGAVVMENVSVL